MGPLWPLPPEKNRVPFYRDPSINNFMKSFLTYLTEDKDYSHPEWPEVRLAMKLKEIPHFTKKEFVDKIESSKIFYKKNFSNIENTDAPISSIRKARNLFLKYKKGTKEDFESLIKAVKEKKTPPIIIFRDSEEKRQYLIAGNTRAMIASALGIRHKVQYLEK